MSQLAQRKGFKIESTLPPTKKTKEKKSKPKGPEHVKIIDDDAPIPWGTTHEPVAKVEEEVISFEDAPVVVGIVDERPSDVREKERFKDAKRWRTAAFEEVPEPGSIGPQPKPQKSSSSHSRQKRGSSDDSDPDIDRSSSRRKDDPDSSPPRRKTHVKDDDPSPPRRRRQSSDDPSPPRRKRDDSSPPRRRPPQADDDPSPPRRRDSSPPRRKHKYNDDPSPPRRRETSPPRRRQIKEEDASPPRRRDRSSPSHRRDESRSRRDSPSASSSNRRQPKNEPSSPLTHRRPRQESPPLPAQPAKSERRKLAEHKEKLTERYAQWGRGLAQVQQVENAVKDYLEQADKPLARYRDDSDLDTMLKKREREDDPMLKYLSKGNSDGGAAGANGERAPPKPRYRGPDPQKNRFDIWPGYRWDGVDRSNGYEKKLFESIANRHAKTQEAYLWSVEDM